MGIVGLDEVDFGHDVCDEKLTNPTVSKFSTDLPC